MSHFQNKMACTLILKGDFEEIWVVNMERPCMIRIALEYKERNMIYKNKPIIENGFYIENFKEQLTRFCCAENKVVKNHLQLRMTVDQDLKIYDYGIDQKKVLKVVIGNIL